MCVYRAVKYGKGTQTKKVYNALGLIKPPKGGLDYKARSAGGREAVGNLGDPKPRPDLTRWRSLIPEISSKLQKIERFRGCRQGVTPPSPLALGPEQPSGKAGRVSAGQPRGRVQVK